MDDDDEFNDFEEAQPPAPCNPGEQVQGAEDLGWNAGVEGTSLPLQNEGGDIGSTFQTGSGTFGFEFDLESPLQVDPVEQQMGKIGSVYDLANTTIIPPFTKQNSLQLPISSTDLFDFNTAIQPQIETPQFQVSETPSFLPVPESERPQTQQSQFLFQFEPTPVINGSNLITSNPSTAQYSLDLFDWGKTQISKVQQQQKQGQFQEGRKNDEEEQFDFSGSIASSLVVNESVKLQEQQKILQNQQKEEEEQQFQFSQPQKSDTNIQEVKEVLLQEQIKQGQTEEIFSQFQTHKVTSTIPLNFSIENFNYSQPVIITTIQDSQIRKESDEFQFGVAEQPKTEQERKQSEDFQFQEETTQVPQFQQLQQIQEPKINIQSQFQFINPTPLSNFYEVQSQQPKAQTISPQAPLADNDQQDEFGDFQQPPSGQQLPISNLSPSIATSAPVQPVQINKQYSSSYQSAFYKEKKDYLDKFVANLPDYSFLLTRGFLN